MPEAPELVCLCASHINTIRRWIRFRQMLESWRQQSWGLKLFVSMSFDAILRPHCSLPAMPGLTIIEQPAPRSQFQHYAHLMEIDFPANTNVMFTDDDDLWHPDRALRYAERLFGAWDQGVSFAYIVSRTTVNTDLDHPRNVASASDVDSLFRQGVLEPDRDINHSLNICGNYVEYVVAIATLKHFISASPPQRLSHKFCDVTFVRYLREDHAHPIDRVQPPDTPWLYFYRRDPLIGQVTLSGHGGSKDFRTNVDLVCAVYGRFSLKLLDELCMNKRGCTRRTSHHSGQHAYKLARQAHYLTDLPAFSM